MQRKREALFLVCLDDTVLTTEQTWIRDLRRQRRIGDFTHWKREHDHYQKALQRLLHDLQAEERSADGQERNEINRQVSNINGKNWEIGCQTEICIMIYH